MTIASGKAPIDQIGFVTRDLDRAVETWIQTLGVGPWMVFRDVRLEGTYRGEAVQVLIDVALGYRGGEQIEFIQPRSTCPSPYQHDDGTPIEGVHHLAWIVDDIEAEAVALEARGFTRVFSATNPAVEVIYLADPAQPGVYYELIAGPDSRAMHTDGIQAARTWDGSDPITEISLA